MKRWFCGVAMLVVGAIAAAAAAGTPASQPGTQPTSQPMTQPKPMTIEQIAAKIPKELWPADKTKERDKWLQENFKGQLVVFPVVWNHAKRQPRAVICGLDAESRFHADYQKGRGLALDEIKAHAEGREYTAVGGFVSLTVAVPGNGRGHDKEHHQVQLTDAWIVR